MSDTAAPRLKQRQPPYRRLVHRLSAIEDGAILRFAFFALLAGTLSVLYVDYRELMASQPFAEPAALEPILPPFDPGDGGGNMQPAITSSPEVLETPLGISLESGGVLRLTGTLDPGAADRFATEIAARGDYVETVELDSPGGSVADALAIGALIRERGYSTSVGPGRLCASSCPIVFASGVARYATPTSAIGVHQVYAAAITGDPAALLQAAGMAMSEAQRTTATITRHLTESGVDPALWLHALETPPSQLYYLTPEQMVDFALVTEMRT